MKWLSPVCSKHETVLGTMRPVLFLRIFVFLSHSAFAYLISVICVILSFGGGHECGVGKSSFFCFLHTLKSFY
jgi:hypothetical protein